MTDPSKSARPYPAGFMLKSLGTLDDILASDAPEDVKDACVAMAAEHGVATLPRARRRKSAG